jgi:hypothetical protein
MVKKTNLIPSQSDSFGRVFLKIVAVFTIFFMYSCNDDQEAPATDRLFTIQIGDNNYKVINKSVGAIKDCERLSIGFIYDQPDGWFSINFNILKNGALDKASLVLYPAEGGVADIFDTADFNPIALMKITNFKYDEATNYVHFEYSGEVILIQGPRNSNKDLPRKFIQGVVTITNLDNYKCNTFLPTAQFETPTVTFIGTRANATHDPSLNSNPYIHRFYSNNGYRMFFNLKDDFWNFEKGKTYKFDQNTIENKIDFQHYTGRFRATQTFDYEDSDWKKFETAGSFTILAHIIINGHKVSKGEMNLQVYDNGVLIHNIVNGKFEGRSF